MANVPSMSRTRRTGRRGASLRPHLVLDPRPAAARQDRWRVASRSSSSCRRCSICRSECRCNAIGSVKARPWNPAMTATRAPEPDMRRRAPEPPTSAPPAPAPGPRGGDTAEVQPPPPPVTTQPSRAPRPSPPPSEAEKPGDPAGGGGPPPGVPARRTDRLGCRAGVLRHGPRAQGRAQAHRLHLRPGAASGTRPRAGDRAEGAPGAQHRAPVRDPPLQRHHLRAGRRPQAALHHPAS